MQTRIAGRIHIHSAHRDRKHEPIADARVFAVADDGGAVVEEHAKERNRFRERRRRKADSQVRRPTGTFVCA